MSLSLRVAAGSILKYLFNDLVCFSHLFASFFFKKNVKMLFKENKIKIQTVINKLLNKYIMMLDTSDKATVFSLYLCKIN